MNRQRAWTMLGWVCTALGIWLFAWGVSHLGEPPMSNPSLLYDASYSRSRQLESTFTGLMFVLFGYGAFRNGRK